MNDRFDTDFEYDLWFEEERENQIIKDNEVEVNG